MELKHSVMTGMLGRISDRFHEYQPYQGFEDRLQMAGDVAGMDGIEVVYPQELGDPDKIIPMIKDAGLTVSAVNLNVKSEKKWQTGSFTSTDPKLRANAVANMKLTMDLAAELSTDMITCCPLIDGHNYNFGADYLKQWKWLEEGIAEAAQYRSDIKVSLEYKPNESRNYCILRDMGRTLYLCERVGEANVGVTMDVGHALVAGESPAEALAMAALADRLFYVHFNDNARDWDWDMLPGSVNLWDLLEVLFYMNQLDWSGWLAYDVITRDGGVIESMSASINIVKTAEKLLHKLGTERIQGLVEEGIPARTFDYLIGSLV
jgi:xylose isomerase